MTNTEQVKALAERCEMVAEFILSHEEGEIFPCLEFVPEEVIHTIDSGIELLLRAMRVDGSVPLKSREKILLYLKDHPACSAVRLAALIGISPKAVEKHLSSLKTAGLIRRDGPDKGGRWTVV